MLFEALVRCDFSGGMPTFLGADLEDTNVAVLDLDRVLAGASTFCSDSNVSRYLAIAYVSITGGVLFETLVCCDFSGGMPTFLGADSEDTTGAVLDSRPFVSGTGMVQRAVKACLMPDYRVSTDIWRSSG